MSHITFAFVHPVNTPATANLFLFRFWLLSCFAVLSSSVDLEVRAQDRDNIISGLTFLAGFDGSGNATWAMGDQQVYHAKSLDLKDPQPGLPPDVVQLDPQGKFGGSAKFGKRSEVFTFFRGEKNVAYSVEALDGTVSLWMKLDPQADLEPGYVDPLQITDKAWNDSCLFLDFTKDDVPRHFRLGVFSDYKYWNPTDIGWDNIAVKERPMIVVEKPTFAADRWTHVAFVWKQFNSPKSTAELYVDGKLAGQLVKPQRFTWNSNKLAIIPGIYYSGGIDELAIWSRSLSAEEIAALSSDTQGLAKRLKR